MRFIMILLTVGMLVQNVSAADARPMFSDRVALVIGNGNYGGMHLRNPVNDAKAVAERLQQLGFSVDA